MESSGKLIRLHYERKGMYKYLEYKYYILSTIGEGENNFARFVLN